MVKLSTNPTPPETLFSPLELSDLMVLSDCSMLFSSTIAQKINTVGSEPSQA
jgi:hypothetical protein